MAYLLEVEMARNYALDFALERFDCPRHCIRERGQRVALDPPKPQESVTFEFEDKKCAMRFDEILRGYDPDRVSKLVKF